MEKQITSNVTKGIIIALILIVLDLASSFGEFKYAKWYTWIPSLALIAAMVWACITYSNQLDARVSFGNIFAHGFKTSAVVACLLFVYTLLAIYVIFPDMKEKAMEQAMIQMEKQGNNMPEETREQALKFSEKLFAPLAITAAVLGTLIVGVIGSLIGAAIAKKNPPPVFENKV